VTPPRTANAPKDPAKDFVAAVLGDTEDVWHAVFKSIGARYEPPRLVLFRGSTRSACGRASASTGPFYCSADRELYLDTDFFNELSRRFGAPGDFAQAYVIAHEVGHHVQNLTGAMKMVDQKMQGQDARGRNALSVRLELQADCYAGLWGFYAQKRNLLEAGDLEEGFRAASAVGDDSIQKRAQGYVVPESFTHGSAEQRLRWFRIGLESGDLRRCNTFATGGPN
jgi:predicted metalloprotease